MIHHLSIPAVEPGRVAEALSELLGGPISRFGPGLGGFIAWAKDGHGTAVEIFPAGAEMLPGADAGPTVFRYNPHASPFIATHAAISVERTEAEILDLARRLGWRALRLSRGGFDVIEFWIENRVMLEVLTPEMAASYLQCSP